MKAHWSVLAVLALTHGALASEAASAARGRQLFEGELALTARIVGQDFSLPAGASRCVNCHGASRPTATSSPAATQPVGPALTRTTLTDAASRRGGPPSRYDDASLCKLLRSGVDPAHVMIMRTMPRYKISDADCSSLWQYLTDSQAR